jgi:ethanolamine utilization protein EutN
MYIGLVTGSAVATIKHKTFEGKRLLVVEKLGLNLRPTSDYDICVDVVQAGPGDIVLVLDEGSSSRQILGCDADGTVRAIVAGIIDEVQLAAD